MAKNMLPKPTNKVIAVAAIHLCISAFDVMAFYKMDQFTIFKQGNRGRGGRIRQCVFTCFGNSFFVNPCKHGG